MNADFVVAIRDAARKTLERRGLSQAEFARKHGLSHSWLNKFLCGKELNPRVKSLSRLQQAMAAEKGRRTDARAAS